jgi:hypothetical protein
MPAAKQIQLTHPKQHTGRTVHTDKVDMMLRHGMKFRFKCKSTLFVFLLVIILEPKLLCLKQTDFEQHTITSELALQNTRKIL